MKRLKLNNLYSLTNAVFTDLQTLDVPWKSKSIAQKLDIAYMGNQSGQKYISPLLEQFVEDDEITPADRATIASVIFSLNNDNWTKLYNTLSLEYNPIENYHMLEEMTDDETKTDYGHTNTRTDNLTHTKAGSEAITYNTSDARTDNLTHTKAGSEEITYNTSDARTDNLTHTKAGSEAITYNTSDARTDNLTHTKAGSESLSKSETDKTNATHKHEIKGAEQHTPAISTKNSAVPFNGTNAELSTIASNEGIEQTQYVGREDVDTNAGSETKSGTETTSFTNRVDTDAGTQTTLKTGTETTSFTGRSDTDTGTQTTLKTGTETTSFTGRSDTDTGTQTTLKTGTETTSFTGRSDTDTGTVGYVEGGSDTSTRNYTLERSGNIGTLTTQAMIESERELWLWNFFYKIVFPDVDRILTIDIY